MNQLEIKYKYENLENIPIEFKPTCHKHKYQDITFKEVQPI